MPEEKLVKVDLACGIRKHEGFIGVDILKNSDADIFHDLEVFPWPFESDSVDEIYCAHYIEHTNDMIAFFNELYRILKVGGKAEINAPYYTSVRATQDPTHKHFISESTFLYANKEWRKNSLISHYPLVCDFDFTYGYAIDQEWASRSEEARSFAIKHYFNIVHDITAVLTKREPEK